MNEVKEQTKESILTSLNELEQLIKTRLEDKPSNSSPDLDKKLVDLEKKFQLVNEKNQKVYDILNQVIAELENLLIDENNKCQQ
ncbi:MAG: hypothetical protein HRU36_05240 [Rickettsiales bacterium]|nr:hypothetical protein [Rickettsiales bacterium]